MSHEETNLLCPSKLLAQEVEIFNDILFWLRESLYIAKFAKVLVDASLLSIGIRPETMR